MAASVRNIALIFGLLGSFGVGMGIAEAKEKASSSPERTDPLERSGYRPPPGAQIIGDAVESPSGEDIAFFELNGEVRELVVCPRGGAPGRWTVKPETTKLHIYWTGPTQLTLGQDVLAPKMVVRWKLARG